MKALRTKVILSGIVLVFAFIATIGTTFAWFTVSQTATVETLTLNVTAEDNLLIKVYEGEGTGPTDPSLYNTTLDNADLQVGYADLLTWQLSPVTALQNDYDTPVIDGTNLLALTDVDDPLRAVGASVENSATGDYIALQFWLLSQSDTNQVIEIDNLSITTTETPGTPEEAVKDAVRLSVFEDGATAANAYIFGNDTEFDFTWENGDAGYWTGTTGTGVGEGFNNLAEINIGDASGIITNGTNPATNGANVLAVGSTQDILTLVPNTPTLVTVYIFVEGWDADTTNDIISSTFDITWGFVFGTEDV